MNENLLETKYDVTKKNRFLNFYESNKILIYSIIFIIIFSVSSLFVYNSIVEKKKIKISNDYVQAKIYLELNQKDKAKSVLEKIVLSNNSTYSTLSLFLLLEENLVKDDNEMISFFDHVIENNKFEEELKNLIVLKKAIFQSNFSSEVELLDTTKSIINSDSIWKPHALILIGDYFAAQKQFVKAKEFYSKVLSTRNLNQTLYDRTNSRLAIIQNE
tara:strand:- start:48 stop:695 length:648 start_codon:yes stop_codon:yes gene_type:complete